MSKLRENRDWIPQIRFGPYRFGDPIDVEGMDLLKVDSESDDLWDAYRESVADDLRIYTEGNLITCVGAYEYFFYQGKNLIGLPFETLPEILKVEFDHSETQEVLEETQLVYRFDSLSLVVWVKNGHVETIQCSEKVED